MILTMDPGTSSVGLAFWRTVAFKASMTEKRLVRPPVLSRSLAMPPNTDKVSGAIELAERIVHDHDLRGVHEFHVEWMTVYGSRMDAANDLIGIAYFTGLMASKIVAVGGRVQAYTAMEWKGNMPKAITEARIRKVFDDAGHKLAARKSSHEMDAIGIGLFVQGLL